MPKFARPNVYNGRQSNQAQSGATRAANSVEVAAGLSEELYISPATLDAVIPSFPLSVPNGGTGLATITDHGVMVGSGAGAVTPLAVGTNGQVLTGATGADPSFAALGTNSGLTAHGVLVGEGNSAIAAVATSATAGVPLVSAGAAADPAFGTAVVAGGGTGVTSATAYAVLTGGTTATGAFQSVASVGTAGQVLTSNGAGALPSFQAAPGIQSATVTLTNAEVKALNATPITVLAAQGAGNYVNLIAGYARMNYGGNDAFTGTYRVSLQQGGVRISNNVTESGFNATVTTYSNFFVDTTFNSDSTVLNSAVTISSDDPIGGNASNDNTVTVTIYYNVVTP